MAMSAGGTTTNRKKKPTKSTSNGKTANGNDPPFDAADRRSFEEVDARITIPLAPTATSSASSSSMDTNRMMMKKITPTSAGNSQTTVPSTGVMGNVKNDASLLRTGINKYRSLHSAGSLGSSASSLAASGRAERHEKERNSHEEFSRGNAISAEDHAMRLVEKKQYAAAIPYLTEALEQRKTGSNGRISSVHSNAAVQQQSRLKLLHQRGTCYLAAQKYQPAIDDFSKIIQSTPKNPQLFAKRARSFAGLKEYHSALDDYDEAIEILASSSSSNGAGGGYATAALGGYTAELRRLYIARSKVYRAMNNLKNAVFDLNRAEGAHGERDAPIYYLRAQLHAQCGNTQLAIQDLDHYIELQEDYGEQELLLDTSSTNDSMEQPEMVDVLMERAALLQRHAAEDDAQERKDVEFLAIEQGEPSRSVVTGDKNLQHPMAYRSPTAIKLVERSIQDYSLVLAKDPEHVDALRLRGEAYGHLDRYEEALQDFAVALHLEPNDFEVRMSRAKLYRQKNQLFEAIDEVTRVLEVNGFFIDGLFFRGKLFEEVDDYTAAQRDYTSIIEAHFDILGQAAGGKPIENGNGNKGNRGNTSQKSSTKKDPPKVAAKMTSKHAAQALLFRARLSLRKEEFDAAMQDYKRILASFSNNMEAQLELQETEDKKRLYEERKHREAIEWVEQLGNEEAEDGTGAKSNIGGSNSTGKNKKRKKKKKKKSRHAGYVLLEDDEDMEIETAEEAKNQPEEAEPTPESVDSVELPAVEQIEESPVTESDGPPVIHAIGVTRDEACESMWEQSEEQMDSDEYVPSRMQSVVNDYDEREDHETLPSKDVESTEVSGEDEEEGVDGDGDGDDNGSTTDSNSNVTVREVLMDEKYLKKRQKQLEKLRQNFHHVSDMRDKTAIEEVLERAERKQMAGSLTKEIEHAKQVLEELDKEEEEAKHRIQQPTRELTQLPVDEQTKRRIQQPGKEVAQLSTNPSHTLVDDEAPSKQPSLVIRPIAYGQALQLAELNQHQLLQNQRLLQEQEAEIAYLRKRLVESERMESIEKFDHLDDTMMNRLNSLRTNFAHYALKRAEQHVDQLVDWMGPSLEADQVRHKILNFVQRVLEANISPGTPIFFFPMGSFPMKTYLPTADVDVCLLLPQELEPTWHFLVLNALCMAGNTQSEIPMMLSSNGSPNRNLTSSPSMAVPGSGVNGGLVSPTTHTVRNVSFINADVRVIKCTIDNVAVDLTVNRVGALGALMLLDSMDTRVGRQHLLKRSLILIKSWCSHESHAYTMSPASSSSAHPMHHPPAMGGGGTSSSGQSVLGASHGAFSTYAINTVVMALFNQYGDSIAHPLQALYLFLDRMAEFPWHEAAMTLYGSIPLSVLATTPLSSLRKKTNMTGKSGRSESLTHQEEFTGKKIGLDDVERIRGQLQDQFSMFDASLALSTTANGFKVPLFPVRVCNIVDPLDEKNNLARSVSVDWFPVMKRAFRLGRNRLGVILTALSAETNGLGGPQDVKMDELGDFFTTCWKVYGRGDGWRPDLLIHPRQAWHGNVSRPKASQDDEKDDQRWQSLLPNIVTQQQPQHQYAPYHQYQVHQPHRISTPSPILSGPSLTAAPRSTSYGKPSRRFDSPTYSISK